MYHNAFDFVWQEGKANTQEELKRNLRDDLEEWDKRHFSLKGKTYNGKRGYTFQAFFTLNIERLREIKI